MGLLILRDLLVENTNEILLRSRKLYEPLIKNDFIYLIFNFASLFFVFYVIQ